MKLGNIEVLDPKTLGIHEEHQFTPWLLENLNKLGDALGIDFTQDPGEREREVQLGRYILDIQATEAGTGRKVIIENQLRPSDHSHLGQLLTYATLSEGSIIVWVCHELRDEHRRVLDWLNSRLKGVGFFGVEFEVIKIDGSNPAFRFVTVVRPPEWEEIEATVSGDVQVSSYKLFFQPLIDELRTQHKFTNARIAQDQSWYSFAAGYSGLSYSAVFVATTQSFRVELYLQTKQARVNKAIYDGLEAHKDEIENNLGIKLEWDRGGNKQYARISTSTAGGIAETEGHPALRTWAVEWLLKFKKVFGNYLPDIVDEAKERLGE